MAEEGSKCIKFERALRLEIKQSIRYQDIHQFSTLVNKGRIYDEYGRSDMLIIGVLVKRKEESEPWEVLWESR